MNYGVLDEESDDESDKVVMKDIENQPGFDSIT